MASHEEAEAITGLQVGGISALALLNRGFIVLMDRSAEQHEWVCVSAGRRGINLRLPVRELIAVTRARLADLTE
jgi:Cys-tRNA(Pro)/Cys-tRNA(Cys) deacylase